MTQDSAQRSQMTGERIQYQLIPMHHQPTPSALPSPEIDGHEVHELDDEGVDDLLHRQLSPVTRMPVRPDKSESRSSSLGGSIFNMINAVVGVGILALPAAMAKAGWLLGLIMLLGVTCYVVLTMLLLERSLSLARRKSYSGVVGQGLGQSAAKCTDALIVIVNLGTALAYLLILSSSSVDLWQEWIPVLMGRAIALRPAEFMLDDRQVAVCFFAIFVLFPLSSLPRLPPPPPLAGLQYLRHVSIMALCAIVYMILVVVIRALQRYSDTGVFNCASCPPVRPYLLSTEIFASLSTFSFAFTVHTVLPPIHEEMARPTGRRGTILVTVTCLTVSLFYGTTMLFGYLQFGPAVCANMTETFGGDKLMALGRLGIVISVIAGFPMMMSPLRQSVHQLLFPSVLAMSCARRLSITVAIMLFTMCVCLVVDDLGSVIEMTGAIGSSCLAYVLPGLTYANLKYADQPKWKRFCSIAGLSAILGVMITTANVLVVGSQQLYAPVQDQDTKMCLILFNCAC